MASYAKTPASKRGAGFNGMDLGMTLAELPALAHNACSTDLKKTCSFATKLDDMPVEVDLGFLTQGPADKPARLSRIDALIPNEFYDRIFAALKARYGEPAQDQFGPLWQWRPPVIPKELNYQAHLYDQVRIQRLNKRLMRTGQNALLISYEGHASASWRGILMEHRRTAAKREADNAAERKCVEAEQVPAKRLGSRL